ncbi:MAG: beta-N-acetylhexosaminidase, partial [Planctomycetota bacterium]|nr:beta-N-acetylhexosaminidase [Planctomycetota bacterium]
FNDDFRDDAPDMGAHESEAEPMTFGVAGMAAGSHRQTVSVIPKPVSVECRDGYFAITRSTRIIAENDAAAEASKLIDALAPAMGFGLHRAVALRPRDNAIRLELNEEFSQLGGEGYELDVSAAQVAIRAQRPVGLFHGIQTLLQLLPVAIFSKAQVENVAWSVPCVKIVDHPRFQWRGLLVDPARHFIPKKDLLRFIDSMALHKFNSLQIHLTDDQGWRIEIKKYPKLTQIGAWRDETLVDHASHKPRRYDGKRHGGFYTHEDIRHIVRYAAARHIRIVPEIEMPGHARSAISSYPYLGVFPKKQKDLKPWTHWGVSGDIFAPRQQTVAFLQDVLSEVMELFPSRYIHIGGDEAIKNQWQASEEVQALIRAKGLKDEAELQGWFIRQMDTFLAEHGRRLIGWDEILQGGLAPGATVMSWRGAQGGITAANAGHDVVMAPTTHTYFDYYQGVHDKEPLAIGGNLPLAKVYSFEPVPDAVTPEKTRHILGVQGQLWGEYISTARHRDYMIYPRAAALAEVAWSPKASKDYDDFLSRLRPHLTRLESMGVNYRDPD